MAWKNININCNNIKKHTGSSVLIGMPNSSCYKGYEFWHPAKVVRDSYTNGYVNVGYTDDWEFVLKKYGKGRYNKHEVIDEVTITVEEFENAFKNMDDQACKYKVVQLNDYETHKPEKLEATECEVLEELKDE